MGHGSDKAIEIGERTYSAMIVMKFGGSSLESAAAIQRVAGIVRSRLPRHPVVVVSAMGKTTNALLAMAADAAQGNRAEAMASCARSRNFTGANPLPSSRREAHKELETDPHRAFSRPRRDRRGTVLGAES